MPSLEKLLDSAKKKVTPPEAERRRIGKTIRQVLDVADTLAGKKGVGHTLAGSYLRDTWMPHKKEFDLFLLFPETMTREQLERMGLQLGKKIVAACKGKHTIAYAEHPYVRAQINGYAVDIVPCYKVQSAEQMKSAVDRTPFHNKWLAESLPAGASGEVRLLKQLLKNNGMYGSDNKTLGFSGYLCELLIIHYGSFKKLLEAAAAWSPGAFIDIEGRSEFRHTFRQQGHPLIVIDPVDRKRNVAAVLSHGNFVKMTRLCHRFLQAPSSDFFFREPSSSFRPRQKTANRHIILQFPRPAVVDDTLWPQLRKAAGRLAGLLREADFQAGGSFVWADDLIPGKKPAKQKCWILVQCPLDALPPTKEVRGPPHNDKQNAAKFRQKYKTTVRDGRLWASAPRQFMEPQQLLKAFLRHSPKALREKGIPSAVPLKKAAFLTSKKFLHTVRKNRPLARAFMEWTDRTEK